MNKSLVWLVAGALAAGTASASREPMRAGKLVVHNDAGVFSPAGVKAAQDVMGDAQFYDGLTLTVDTVKDVPESRQAELKQKGETAFFRDWARERARDEKAGGVFVLVCRSPAFVYVEAGERTVALGFTPDDEKKLHDIFLKAFADSRGKPDADAVAARDAGLKAAVEFVVGDLAGKVPDTSSAPAAPAQPNKPAGGTGVMGWVCLGLSVLLGAWLVVALVRAFTGGGAGGRRGFLPLLLGGLFGAVAGAWLYSSFFGGGLFGGGSDAAAGDGGDYGDSGGDDFGGGDGAGGGFDGGDF